MSDSFFYDGQLRRYLLQITRLFSNFYIEYGTDDQGNASYVRVPVRYGDSSRQAQAIIQNNSSSGMPSAPMITFYITGMEYSRDRVQEPYHISKMNVRQRKYNPTAEDFETTQGNAFTVERHMPVPYDMSINVDIWTSNNMQKHQLFEQIVPLFNPSLEIQSTDNFIDWTSLSAMYLDRTTWSSKNIPMGTDDTIDVMTLGFSLPVWISQPARVKKLGVVHKIITSIYDSSGDALAAIENDDLLTGTRIQITPWGYRALLIGNQLKAFKQSSSVTDFTDPVDWKAVLEMYGVIRDGISLIRIGNSDSGNEVTGTVALHPTDPKILLFTADQDSVPSNTLAPVNAVIDPLKNGPGVGLPVAAIGIRYLLIDNIGDTDNTQPSLAWGNVVANINDIIEWNGTQWVVDFDAAESTNTEFVSNITTGIQYRWDGLNWLKSFEGVYEGGSWSLVI